MSDYEHSLFQKLNSYAQSDYYPLHMPGHKRNIFLKSGAGESSKIVNPTSKLICPGSIAPERVDITEITDFDDLHHPTGILKEAQERTANVFGARKSYYLVNGSTAGILAAICACTKKGGRILMARNCHKSVYHAALLQELSIDYPDPPVLEFGIVGSILPEAVSKKISETQLQGTSIDGTSTSTFTCQAPTDHSFYQAVVITSPTYDGIISDIQAIAEIAHAHRIPLIVDAAHGAHFGFSNAFPKKAFSYGADIVIESLHKTLPAFTQSAVLHLADSPYVDESRIKHYLPVFQTSSPSYLLMAGIDRCTQILQTDGQRLFSDFEKKLAAFYEKAAQLNHINVLYAKEHLQVLKGILQDSCSKPRGSNFFGKDPSKILISADAIGMTGKDLFAVLRDHYHLELEMSSLHYVTALTSIMDTQEGFDRLIAALEELDRMDSYTASNTPGTTAGSNANVKIISGQKFPAKLHEAIDLPSESAPLSSVAGSVCADFIIPYPPGIPILVPGEIIRKEHVQQILTCLAQNIPVYGIE